MARFNHALGIHNVTQPKAYSYVRMSSDAQLSGDSLRRQVERSNAYAKSNQLELDEQFKLQDIGVSAFDGSNVLSGQLGLFLKAVNDGRIAKGSFLLVESLDRLSREDALSALGTFTNLLKAGITIVTLSDNKRFVPEKIDAMDLIYSLLVMSRAHEEFVLKSDRISAAWRNKRANAKTQKLTARCPSWLRMSPDRTRFEVLEDRKLIVERIFRDLANGMGSFAIARRLNQEGVTTFGNSKGWQNSYIKKIFDNKSVLGQFQPRTKKGRVRNPSGDPVPDYYPRIISDELFYRARAATVLRRRAGGGRKGPNVSNLFSKLAICGTCGRSMRYLDKGKKGGQRLICDGFMRGLGCPTNCGWSYNEFETSFLYFVKEINLHELFHSDANSSRISETNNRLLSLSGEIHDMEERRERTYNLLTQSKFPGQALEAKYAELEAGIDTLQTEYKLLTEKRDALLVAKLNTAESQEQLIPLIKSVQKSNTGDNYERRTLLASILSSIVEEIRVFPAGLLWPLKQVAEFRQNIIDAGDDIERVDHYIDNFINPGLKNPRDERFFSVVFKDQTMRNVRPDANDPAQYYYVKKYSLSDATEIESSTLLTRVSTIFSINQILQLGSHQVQVTTQT